MLRWKKLLVSAKMEENVSKCYDRKKVLRGKKMLVSAKTEEVASKC